MKVDIGPGKYVVAVSGGVDSVVLLDLLTKQKNLELAVAHFDHGIRENSTEDRVFVEKLAAKYGLGFFYEEGNLGSKASEALAREKRYEFLNKIKDKIKAKAVITAHHEDDLLETVVINLLRGSGRKGLSSLQSRTGLLRPLLSLRKAELLDYAEKNNLAWQEDETNKDESYLRNYVRHSLLVKLSGSKKQSLLEISKEWKLKNDEIDQLINDLFFKEDEWPRYEFNILDHNLACEVVANWLRLSDANFDKKTVERLVIQLKTVQPDKTIQINNGQYFVVKDGYIRMNAQGVV